MNVSQASLSSECEGGAYCVLCTDLSHLKALGKPEGSIPPEVRGTTVLGRCGAVVFILC